jgi:CRISPR/Cas system CMR-associated protein Cmr5 small subunit
MSDDKHSLENKLELLEKTLSKYEKLDNHKKLSGIGNRIKKDINLCKTSLEQYSEMLDKPDDHIGEVIIYKDESDLNEKQFEKYIEKMDKIKEDIVTNKSLTIDEQINLYLDLVFSVKWCREYLRTKHMKVKNIDKKK